MARGGLFGWLADLLFGEAGPSSTSSSQQAPYRGGHQRSTNTYRPTQAGRARTVRVFRDHTSRSDTAPAELSGINDAFTGAALDASLGLYRCNNCRVYYHAESVRVLQEANHGRCVACSSADIISIAEKPRASEGRNFDPDVVTLADYRSHVGRVVTFQGRVVKVLASRRGGDYAVMFEDKPWTSGFKLVFFRGALQRVGGKIFLNSLPGKNMRIRGLLIQHPRFGYEVIISERSMILAVS